MRLRALALVAVALAAPLSAGARPAATSTTVIDRTFSCSATPDTVKKIQVSAVSGFRDPANRQRWKWPAAAAVTSHFRGVVGVIAGALPNSSWRALSINPERCKATAGRVPLSASGLTGGVASRLQGVNTVGSDAYECVVSSRLLVRVRAVFRAPVALRVQRFFGQPILMPTTAAAAQEGQFAVRTQAGKPLAYASVSETGKATLFTARSCVSD